VTEREGKRVRVGSEGSGLKLNTKWLNEPEMSIVTMRDPPLTPPPVPPGPPAVSEQGEGKEEEQERQHGREGKREGVCERTHC